MLSREIIQTEDGSVTIYLPEWNESYHSKHGAVQEAYHVFIENGLDLILNQSEVSILEFGFGTGLNSFISMIESIQRNLKIQYIGLEKFPVTIEEFSKLNYPQSILNFNPKVQIDAGILNDFYLKMMNAEWNEYQAIHDNFMLKKVQTDFFDFEFPNETLDLIYFDAFGARVQPELWTVELFERIYQSMKFGGIFTTYSAKGSVRRALQEVGLKVEKRPGPPGKREMLIAVK